MDGTTLDPRPEHDIDQSGEAANKGIAPTVPISIPKLIQLTARAIDSGPANFVRNFTNDLYAADADGNDWIDRAFDGGDIYRTIHRYLERANGGFKNRLSRSLIQPVLVMHFARQIAECASDLAPPAQSAD